MKIGACQQHLAAGLSATRSAPPEGSVLGDVARKISGMASAYESDGLVFAAKGDLVNALASFYYGYGWLHFGNASGLLITNRDMSCPFSGPLEKLSPEYREPLEEKTGRYSRLLDTARHSVTCGPDPATAAGAFAERILCIAGSYARQGKSFMDDGNFEGALASFSYGHGWLDAAVTAGSFRIVAERELFTV